VYESKTHELAAVQSGARVADEEVKKQATYIRKIEQRLRDVTQSLDEQREQYNTIFNQHKALSQKR
jgi:phosphopantetheine adenylyltransferase